MSLGPGTGSALPDASPYPLDDAGSQRILANTAYRAAADIGSKIISVAFFVVLARQLGESGFGVFVFGLALAAVLTVLASFGQDPVLTREVARDLSRLDAYFANTLALKLVLALPVLLVAAAVVTAAGMDSETRSVVVLLGIALVAEQLATTCFAVYQARERLVYVPIVILTQRALTAAVGIVALLAGAGVVAVSAIYVGGALAALALALALLYRRVARPRLLVTPRTWGTLFAAAAPVGVATVLALLLFRVDTAILALFESDEIVGNYGAAFRLFEATLFISWAVTSAVYPVLARLSPGSESVRDVFGAALKLIVALTLPVAVGAAILADPIVHLVFGSGFDEAVTPLVLLAPAIVVYSLAHVAGAMLVARNRQRAMAITNGVVAALNIVANFTLIPLLSLDGAALVALASQVALAVVLLAIAGGVAGKIAWRRILAGPLTAAALLALTTVALRDNLGAALGGGAAVYVVALVLFERVAYPEDARAIRNFVRGRRNSEATAR
jgi:O-antigen/teichoic acid export membrane protein